LTRAFPPANVVAAKESPALPARAEWFFENLGSSISIVRRILRAPLGPLLGFHESLLTPITTHELLPFQALKMARF
jgi:hypothetical protein